MVEKRTIGQILINVGRITEEDVVHALEYQEENGGYFGEALVSCGFVTDEELDWGLASQFDLPYVFPEADSVDAEAAAMVSPEWALAHLTLPIMMTADSLTVIIDSPLKGTVVEELAERTGRRIELALASASKIRDLIRQVYARGAAADEGHGAPLDFSEVLDELLTVESTRFGISVRGPRPSAWWDDCGTIRRRPLAGHWLGDLERMITPSPTGETSGKPRAEWSADLTRAGIVTPLTVQYMADESGSEYVFQIRPVESVPEERFPPPPAGVLSEVQLLARSGTARFIVTTDPSALGHEILPHLPPLLLDPLWRSIYLHARDQAAAAEVFSHNLPADSDKWAEELEALRAFHFDVVTVDLSGGNGDWVRETLDVASVAFLLWQADEETRPAYEAGIRWCLHIDGADGDPLEWSLEPLHG